MTAQELLIRQSDRNLDVLKRTVRTIPVDKLAWKPTPESRSALDMLQEIATVLEMSGDMYKTRKLEMDQAAFGKWMEERQSVTEVDTLLEMIEKATAKNNAAIAEVPDEDLLKTFEMPWPGEFLLVDTLGYHPWNLAYHEAQIYYISTLIEGGDAG